MARQLHFSQDEPESHHRRELFQGFGFHPVSDKTCQISWELAVSEMQGLPGLCVPPNQLGDQIQINLFEVARQSDVNQHPVSLVSSP